MLERFQQFIAKENLFHRNQKILLAVSAGIDSICMLDLFAKGGYSFGIVHCNFGLRGFESEGDAHFVASLAKQYQVPFFTEKFDTEIYASTHKISIQMAARDLRYAFFNTIAQTHGFDKIAIAHHSNDSIETILINFIRGSGSKGLAGIQAHRGNIIRPLSPFTRADIEAYTLQFQLHYREDSSNAESKYLRNKIRLELLPFLKALNPNIEETLVHNARIQEDLDAIKQSYVNTFIQNYVVFDKTQLQIKRQALYLSAAPQTVLYTLLSPYSFTESDIQSLMAPSIQTGARVESSSHACIVERDCFLVQALQGIERPVSLSINLTALPAVVPINGHSWKIAFAENIDFEALKKTDASKCLYLDASKLKGDMLTLRVWQDGDTMQPLGMQGRKNISDMLTDEKCTTHTRKQQYVLLSGDEIIALVGYRIAESVKVEASSPKLIVLKRD